MHSFAECLFANDTSRKHSSASQASESIVSFEVLVEEFRVFIGSEVGIRTLKRQKHSLVSLIYD